MIPMKPVPVHVHVGNLNLSNKWLNIEKSKDLFYVAILKVKRYLGQLESRGMKSHIRRFVKFTLFSNGNITNKIPIFDAYGDGNLVVTRSNLP